MALSRAERRAISSPGTNNFYSNPIFRRVAISIRSLRATRVSLHLEAIHHVASVVSCSLEKLSALGSFDTSLVGAVKGRRDGSMLGVENALNDVDDDGAAQAQKKAPHDFREPPTPRRWLMCVVYTLKTIPTV